MIKRFLEWMKLKIKIHERMHKPPYVSEGDIWWASIGDNVGHEINGKGKNFTRPVYIYKKLDYGFYLALPTTSKYKIGSWYVPIKQKGEIVTICLHQARVLDYRRLMSKVGNVDDADKLNIATGFKSLYIQNKNPS
jgi:mRNA interferase MazF